MDYGNTRHDGRGGEEDPAKVRIAIVKGSSNIIYTFNVGAINCIVIQY